MIIGAEDFVLCPYNCTFVICRWQCENWRDALMQVACSFSLPTAHGALFLCAPIMLCDSGRGNV